MARIQSLLRTDVHCKHCKPSNGYLIFYSMKYVLYISLTSLPSNSFYFLTLSQIVLICIDFFLWSKVFYVFVLILIFLVPLQGFLCFCADPNIFGAALWNPLWKMKNIQKKERKDFFFLGNHYGSSHSQRPVSLQPLLKPGTRLLRGSHSGGRAGMLRGAPCCHHSLSCWTLEQT